MSFGQGMIHCRSSKQKLNTKSRTEAEVVGVSEYIPVNLWLTMFLKEQGYDLSKNVVFQDIESAIKMLKMVEIRVRADHGILTLGISLLKTGSINEKSTLIIVRLN